MNYIANSIIKFLDDVLESHVASIYLFVLFFIHAVYFLGLFDIVIIRDQYLNYMNIGIQTFICMVLLLRFSPWRKVQLHENDRQIIFASALFLVGNLAITQYFVSYIQSVYKGQFLSNQKA